MLMAKTINTSRQIVIVANNIRSAHNVGSLFRTAEGLAINKLILTGYTPYPISKNDLRLPHIAKKIDNQIQKTALNAQHSLSWSYSQDINLILNKYRLLGYTIYSLEQAPHSIAINNLKPTEKSLIILGNEINGIEKEILLQSDHIIEIPMLGKKESFNVVQAAAIALFYLRYC